MLELGIAGGRAVPLQKRTVGNTNISDVFDGQSHIWPTRDDVAYFYDFNSIQLRFIWSTSNGRDFDTGTNITNAPGIPSEIVGWNWGSSENRTQPFLYWGGDNTQSGAECVMIDIKSIQDVYTNNSDLTMPEEKTRLNDEWKRRLGKEDEDPAWYTDALVCEYNPIKQGCTNQNMSTDNVLRDLSGNGYNIDCYNFAWNTQSGIYDDGSLKLDGVDDYLKVTGLPIMDDFTVMAQNYKYATPPNVLASKSYPTANDGAFILGNVDHAGRGSLRSFGNNGWVTYIQETINVIAMTKTECYKDFDNNVSFYITPGTGVDSDTLWIGRIRDNNSVLGNMRLYSFLMFNRSLTKEEMDWVRNNKMNK